jgi:hypothetical protein
MSYFLFVLFFLKKKRTKRKASFEQIAHATTAEPPRVAFKDARKTDLLSIFAKRENHKINNALTPHPEQGRSP